MTEMSALDMTRGHVDPTTLPQWIFDEWPRETWGYVAAAYLIGVSVVRDSERKTVKEER